MLSGTHPCVSEHQHVESTIFIRRHFTLLGQVGSGELYSSGIRVQSEKNEWCVPKTNVKLQAKPIGTERERSSSQRSNPDESAVTCFVSWSATPQLSLLLPKYIWLQIGILLLGTCFLLYCGSKKICPCPCQGSLRHTQQIGQAWTIVSLRDGNFFSVKDHVQATQASFPDLRWKVNWNEKASQNRSNRSREQITSKNRRFSDI